MASICGPSNALSNLHKHATADRTLQQERLQQSTAGRASPFRSQQQGASSHANFEFEQFSGIPASAHGQFAVPDPVFSAPAPALQQPQIHAAGWTSDFHLVHGQAQAPSPFHPLAQAPSQVPRTATGWEADFFKHSQSMAPQTVTPGPLARAPAPLAYQPFGGNMYPFGSLTSTAPAFQSHQTNKQATINATDAAFEEAFSSAISNMELQDRQIDEALREQAEAEAREREKADEDVRQEGDDLARTAGLLLQSVETDQSQKFKESKFMALMRKLRDKEVIVEGDKVVENVLPANAP